MAPPHVTPMRGTPRTPGVRVQFDPTSSRKKRKISPGQEEASVPFFGMRYPAQPKTTALAVFAFLSNDDLYNAGLVCKSWSHLAMDDELWKFD
jgi:F-box-like